MAANPNRRPMPECPPGYKPNPGYLPKDAKGKRVRVVLMNGRQPADVSPAMPPGWAADEKSGCRWTKTGDEWDIAWYIVL